MKSFESIYPLPNNVYEVKCGGKEVFMNFETFDDAKNFADKCGMKVGEMIHPMGKKDSFIEEITAPLEVSPSRFEGCYSPFGEDMDEEFDALKARISECKTLDEVKKLVAKYEYILDKFNQLDEDEFISYDSSDFTYIDTHKYHPMCYVDKYCDTHEVCVF